MACRVDSQQTRIINAFPKSVYQLMLIFREIARILAKNNLLGAEVGREFDELDHLEAFLACGSLDQAVICGVKMQQGRALGSFFFGDPLSDAQRVLDRRGGGRELGAWESDEFTHTCFPFDGRVRDSVESFHAVAEIKRNLAVRCLGHNCLN